jgi:hypothetical protein
VLNFVKAATDCENFGSLKENIAFLLSTMVISPRNDLFISSFTSADDKLHPNKKLEGDVSWILAYIMAYANLAKAHSVVRSWPDITPHSTRALPVA